MEPYYVVEIIRGLPDDTNDDVGDGPDGKLVYSSVFLLAVDVVSVKKNPTSQKTYNTRPSTGTHHDFSHIRQYVEDFLGGDMRWSVKER